MTPKDSIAGKDRRSRGFTRAASLVSREIAQIGETRGFAVSRLLTRWAEIAGPATARATRPVKVSYAKGGLGGTLTLLVSGAEAPMVEAGLESLRERINACYGYNAISRIRLTQTAPDAFTPAAAPPPAPVDPPKAIRASARAVSAKVRDEGLREALASLGEKILSRPKRRS